MKIRYTVSELAGKNNEKYVLADDQTVTLDYTKEANKRIKTLQIMNTPITGNVFLEKADERTLELLNPAMIIQVHGNLCFLGLKSRCFCFYESGDIHGMCSVVGKKLMEACLQSDS